MVPKKFPPALTYACLSSLGAPSGGKWQCYILDKQASAVIKETKTKIKTKKNGCDSFIIFHFLFFICHPNSRAAVRPRLRITPSRLLECDWVKSGEGKGSTLNVWMALQKTRKLFAFHLFSHCALEAMSHQSHVSFVDSLVNIIKEESISKIWGASLIDQTVS